MATFGERLKLLREERNMTLDDLAEALDTTKSTLSRYENSKREARAEFVSRAADFFEVSNDYILGKTNSRDGILIDSQEKAEKITDDIIQLLIDYGEFTEEEIRSGKLDDEKRKRVINKIRKAINFAQEFDKM